MEIAVVIPALDEADRIEDAIRAARGQGGHRRRAAHADGPERLQGARTEGGPGGDETPGSPEIVVVDGGSVDDTAERARRAGARVLTSPRGRARQLETGWRAGSGEVVVFLHADTRLEDDWPSAVRAALADPAVVGGAFRLRFDDRRLALRVVELIVALRVRLFGLPYGDQAIFVRRRTLEGIGGIPQSPLMEDLDLVAAMRTCGRVVALPGAATTSARRYLEHGLWRTVGRHIGALLMWRLGVDRRRIAGWIGR